MILTKPTQAAAQELADRCHAWLIANDAAYSSSVAAGKTLRWAIPRQNPETGLWEVPVYERIHVALNESERAELQGP